MGIKRTFLIGMGFLSLGVGIVGIALPVLPTTPFLLLSAFCFSQASSRFSALLLRSKSLASYMENYKNKTGVPLGVKLRSIAFLWVTLIISMLLFQRGYLFILLPLIGVGVTLHIALIRTKKQQKA